ncbi:MAG: site-specific DNA-methyltransferase [Anaerolineae bacterium]|nr:site-specific DNA-methyltransferase [Anaerolineae bacterium]
MQQTLPHNLHQLHLNGAGYAHPTTAANQIWEFPSLSQPGRCHRLVIGDCREASTWDRLLNGRPVANIFTSPVYADRRRKTYGGVPADEYVDWFEPVQVFAREHLVPDGSFFINIKTHVEQGERLLYVYDLVLAMKRRWGWRFIDDQVWRRQGFPGRFPNRFKNAHEPVFHFGLTTAVKFCPQNVLLNTDLAYATNYNERGSEENSLMGPAFSGHTARNVKSGRFNGALPNNVIEAQMELDRLDRSQLLDLLRELLDSASDPGNLIEAYTGAHSRGIRYGAAFPVALPEFFIQAFSDPGDAWLDPFAGTGTTAEAAERHGRIAYLIDIRPAAAEETIKRLAQIGLAAHLVGDTSYSHKPESAPQYQNL